MIQSANSSKGIKPYHPHIPLLCKLDQLVFFRAIFFLARASDDNPVLLSLGMSPFEVPPSLDLVNHSTTHK